jgi:hypothetical protein
MTAVMTFFIWKKLWRVDLLELSDPAEMTFNDMLIFAYVAVDLL